MALSHATCANLASLVSEAGKLFRAAARILFMEYLPSVTLYKGAAAIVHTDNQSARRHSSAVLVEALGTSPVALLLASSPCMTHPYIYLLA